MKKPVLSQIDDQLTERYWESAGEYAASSSTMAHEQGLPSRCIAHRVRLERESLAAIASRVSHEPATVSPTVSVGPVQDRVALADELLRQAEVALDPSPLIAAARALLRDHGGEASALNA